MSDGSEQPRWNLLPHDPLGFFGLEEGFELEDLKRAYNRLIRRFKPEKHPAEFQRIRAAYERLDERQRYLGSMPAPREIAERQPRPEPDTTSTADATTARFEPAYGFSADLQARGPELVFRELRNKNDRSALDYYRLAVLSDLVESRDRGDFVGWLIDGVRRRRSSRELVDLLYAYCHRPEAIEQADSLLERLVAVGDPALYGYLTEGLWRRFALTAPFERVARALDRCRRKFRADHHAAIAQLSATVFRASLFRADDSWLQDEWERIADFIEQITGDQLLELLYEYRQEREAFLDGHPLRATIDEVIQHIASGDLVAADRAFLAMQLELGANGEAILEAFPTGDRDWFAVLAVLEIWQAELQERVGERPAEIPLRESRKRVRNLARKVSRLGNRCALGWSWMIAAIGVFVVLPLILAIGGGVELYRHLRSPSLGIPAVLGWVVMLLLIYWRVLLPPRGAFNNWFARRVHEKVWRPEVLDFLLVTGMDIRQLADGFQNVTERIADLHFIYLCALRDQGLRFAIFARRGE